jgi:hypothetical protein
MNISLPLKMELFKRRRRRRRRRIQTTQRYRIQWHPSRPYKLLVFRRETKMHGSGTKEWDEIGNKERLQSFPENMEPYIREIQNKIFTETKMNIPTS